MGWKDDFLKLYTSDDLTKFREALKLKNQHIPPKLYRYRSISDESIKNRYNEIVHGELYLSHPNEFNDPFDACSQLQSSAISRYSARKDIYMKLFMQTIPKDIFSQIFEGQDWFIKLISYVSKQWPLNRDIEKNKLAFKNIILQQYETMNSDVSELSKNISRIASFTTKANNLPMWNHYTDGYRGICLEYNTDDIFNVYQKNMLFPIIYRDSLPDIPYMALQKKCLKFSLFEYMAIHKLKDWSYEDEWRLIYDVGSWYDDFEDVPDEFWDNGKAISFIRPSKIIMGLNINETHEVEIRKMGNIADILVTKAKKTEYGLNVEEV